jgi:acetyl-CoA carboxylase biotin carboxyl carrier protein
MDFDEITKILEMMREHELSEFELERDNFKLRIRKNTGGQLELTEAEEEMELAVVKSPIVGTFYRAPEPGAKPFAEVGEVVKKGQVLCIIEAMKLMNEINAEVDGEVVKVYVENSQAVQYGERLFAIRPA